MKKLIAFILIVVAMLTVLPIAFNNSQKVDFTYLNYDFSFQTLELYLSYIIIGAFVLGVLFAIVFFAITGLVWKVRAKGLQKQVDELLKQRKRDEIEDQFKAEKAAQVDASKVVAEKIA